MSNNIKHLLKGSHIYCLYGEIVSTKYWESKEVKEKLSNAWKSFKQKKLLFKKIKTKKLYSKLLKNKCRTSFEKTYKICYDFKKTFIRKCFKDKIDELIRLSKIKINNNVSYEKRRSKKHRVFSNKKCWCCGKEATVQHHILLILNGGCDNGINRISICDKCHELIHDWMFLERKEKELKEECQLLIEQEYT